MVDSHFRKDSLGNILVEKPYALLSYQVLATLESEKGAVQLAQGTTLAAMMWDFRNVHIAAVHVRTKSDTEKEKGWLIGLRWHLERIINQHKVNFTSGITAFLSSSNFVTLDNRTYFWQCHLPVLLYLEITSVNFLFPEHKLYVSSFSTHCFPSPFMP